MPDSPEKPVPRLGLWLQWRIFLRTLALQGSWNDQRMQNLGLLVTLLPWVRRQKWGINRHRMFCRRYFEYFNTNPYLANLLIGGLVRLESDHALQGIDPTPMARRFRDSLCRACASLGDQLFWLGIRPALTMAMCLLGMFGQWPAILVLVAVFAVCQLVLRFLSLGRSFHLGLDIVELINHPHWHRAIAWTKRLAMLLTGMVAGRYLTSMGNWDFMSGKGLLWVGVALGLGLPLILRRRLPGEGLVALALVLSLLVSFAI